MSVCQLLFSQVLPDVILYDIDLTLTLPAQMTVSLALALFA